MKTKQLLLLVLVLKITTSINAQFKIDAQYRVRGQALHGYKKPVASETDAAFHIGQRTRLNLRYNTEKYSTLLSIQDVRTWGDENYINGTGVQGKSFNNMDIYEAWVNIKFNKKSSLKIGRQEMKYDDQRHISWRNWWDTGMTYDAATFSYKNKDTGWRFDISASYNSRDSFKELTGNDYSGMNDYFGSLNPIQTQNFIYIKRNFKNKMYVSFTAIASGYQKENTPNTIYLTGTEGIHLNYNASKKGTDGFFGIANFFIQNGKDITGTKNNASMITAKLGYRTIEKKLELSAIMERLSGNDSKNTDADYQNTNHTYNLLYGARHPYYEGYLDWFVLPKSSKNGGLINLGVKLDYKMTKKDILWFEFSKVSNVYEVFKEMDGSTPVYYNKSLASTLNLTYIRKLSKNIKWMNGFSYGMPTDDFNQMKGISEGGSNYFFYTMLTFTPKFFDSSK